MMVRGGFSFGVNGGVGIIYLQVSFNSDYYFGSVQWLIRNQCFLFLYVDGIRRVFFFSNYLICFYVMIFFKLDVKFFLGKCKWEKILSFFRMNYQCFLVVNGIFFFKVS